MGFKSRSFEEELAAEFLKINGIRPGKDPIDMATREIIRMHRIPIEGFVGARFVTYDLKTGDRLRKIWVDCAYDDPEKGFVNGFYIDV